jgi:hypothetical protein
MTTAARSPGADPSKMKLRFWLQGAAVIAGAIWLLERNSRTAVSGDGLNQPVTEEPAALGSPLGVYQALFPVDVSVAGLADSGPTFFSTLEPVLRAKFPQGEANPRGGEAAGMASLFFVLSENDLPASAADSLSPDSWSAVFPNKCHTAGPDFRLEISAQVGPLIRNPVPLDRDATAGKAKPGGWSLDLQPAMVDLGQ